MIVTGRAALIALLLTVPVSLAARSWWAVIVVDGLLLLLLALDAWLAGSPRELAMQRSGDHTTRLGEEAFVTLTVRNVGRRPARGAQASRSPGTGSI